MCVSSSSRKQFHARSSPTVMPQEVLTSSSPGLLVHMDRSSQDHGKLGGSMSEASLISHVVAWFGPQDVAEQNVARRAGRRRRLRLGAMVCMVCRCFKSFL